jgi:hypothetical protein
VAEDGAMNAAESLTRKTAPASRWATICEQYPNQWVCLVDVESAPDGVIRSARVLGHHASMRQVIALIGATPPCTVVVHTGGRTLLRPRVEMTDEIRNVVRA